MTCAAGLDNVFIEEPLPIVSILRWSVSRIKCFVLVFSYLRQFFWIQLIFDYTIRLNIS